MDLEEVNSVKVVKRYIKAHVREVEGTDQISINIITQGRIYGRLFPIG